MSNGRAWPRVIATGAGPIEVEAPRVNDKRVDEATGERRRFCSQILAPWCRKSPKVSEVLPLMQAVSSARRAGHAWSAVGAALDTTRQAAQKRFDEPIVVDPIIPDQVAQPAPTARTGEGDQQPS